MAPPFHLYFHILHFWLSVEVKTSALNIEKTEHNKIEGFRKKSSTPNLRYICIPAFDNHQNRVIPDYITLYFDDCRITEIGKLYGIHQLYKLISL